MRLALGLSLIVVCGCNDSPSPGGGGADLAVMSGAKDLAQAGDAGSKPDLATPADLSTAMPDLQRLPDLMSTDMAKPMGNPGAMVMCGNMMFCNKAMPVCCSTDHGMTGMCVAPAGNCGNGLPYYCDDPSDCAMGQVCCLTNAGASCASPADCAAATGTRLCGMKGDCAANESCCGFVGLGGGYGRCQMGPCPICNTRWTALHAAREKIARSRIKHKAAPMDPDRAK